MSDQWLEDYEARRAQERERAQQTIRDACPALECLGIKTVTFVYDGEGDSGAVQEVNFDPVPTAGLPEGLEEVLTGAACEFLPGGWEINEGSFGELRVDVAARTLQRDHNWREAVSHDESETIDL